MIITWTKLASAIGALALALGSPPASAEDHDPQPEVQISADSAVSFDLFGLVSVNVEPDNAAFKPFIRYMNDHVNPSVLLPLDAEGQPTGCEAINDEVPEAYVTLLCDTLLSGAEFSILKGYDLAGRTGQVAVAARNSGLSDVNVVQPVAFTRRGKGQLVVVALANNRPSPCYASNLLGESPIDNEGAEAICAAFMAAPDKAAIDCFEAGQRYDELRTWNCWVKTEETPRGRIPNVALLIRPFDAGNAPTYPPFNVPEDRILSRQNLSFSIRFGQSDFPFYALNKGWEGRVMMALGVEQGSERFVSCRPVTSSGFAILDNAACAKALRRGRVTLNEGLEFEGVKYVQIPVRWLIPN